MVSREELAENDDNLNIRRYVDTTPEPDPQDVRAHLHGGIPLREVEAKADLFAAHGMKRERLLLPKDEDYLQYADVVCDRRDLRRLIELDDGVVAAEALVTGAIEQWWKAEEGRFDKLQSTADLVELRKEFIETFRVALDATSLLDHFAVSGVIASWWGVCLPDLKALATIGYRGLIEAWVSSVLDALREEKAKLNPLEHKVAKALLPEYLDRLAALEAAVTDLDSTIKAATGSDDEDEGEPDVDALPPAELNAVKRELSVSKKQLKAEKAAFGHRLTTASESLDDSAARGVVLGAMAQDLLAEAQDRISRHRRAVISAFEAWWDKCQTPLALLDAQREAAAARLADLLKELGYE